MRQMSSRLGSQHSPLCGAVPLLQGEQLREGVLLMALPGISTLVAVGPHTKLWSLCLQCQSSTSGRVGSLYA